MDTPVIVAIISGIVAIISPIITLLLTRKLDGQFLPISSDRRAILVGHWQGKASQKEGLDKQSLDYTVSCKFTAKSRTVNGEGSTQLSIGEKLFEERFEGKGGFIHDRFLKIEYKIKNANAIQFGYMIFELTADGRTLKGHFLGFGATTQSFVSGDIKLDKVVNA